MRCVEADQDQRLEAGEEIPFPPSLSKMAFLTSWPHNSIIHHAELHCTGTGHSSNGQQINSDLHFIAIGRLPLLVKIRI